MRFHRRYPFLQRWIASDGLRTIVVPANLAIARFEPTMQAMGGGGVLDLIFSDGDAIAVIPLLDATASMLLERERTPVAWPAACAAVPREHLEALEAQIVPWLQSLAFARQLNREEIRTFSSGLPEEVFARARTANMLGAAPYAQIVETSGPYVYAMRFAQAKRVRIADPNGATGAVLVSSRAEVRADLQNAELNALAREWFGADLFGGLGEECDVAIFAQGVNAPDAPVRIVLDASPPGAHSVQMAHPVPTDVMFSFEPEDSSPSRGFGVFPPADVVIRDRLDGGVTASGGSAGQILLLVRDDWQSAPDADVDEARALAERLVLEGFTVRMCGPAAALREGEPADMVHVFTLHHAAEMLEAVKRYGSLGTPVVATAALPRVLNDTVGTPHALMAGFALADEIEILDRLDLLELHVRQATFTESEPRQGYADAIRSLLPHVRAVLVNSEAEDEALRNTYNYAGAIFRVGAMAQTVEPARIAHLTGDRPFALVHAPIEVRANILLLARAAAECGVPLVAAGATADPAVQRTVADILGADFIHISRPSSGELESLYRTARVFVDLSWMPRGLSRIARAIACGCPALVSDRSHARSLWPEIPSVAPGNFSAIRDKLDALWGAPHPVAAPSAVQPFFGIVAAYAEAQRTRAGA